MQTLSGRGPTLESDVYRRQILTSNVDPRTKNVSQWWLDKPGLRFLVQELMIKCFIKDQHRNWDKNLGCLAGAYRSSTHESTQMTPNMLMLEKK